MGDTVLMQATAVDSGDTYTWLPKPFFADGAQPTALGVIQFSGYVGVEVTSQWGCKAADSILATTHPCCEVSLPTGFTPNGDGRNDRFRIITKGHHKVSEFRVVNRWGQTIFETRDETRGWDGTFNGQLQDVGTYYYYVRFRCREGAGRDIEQKGEVVLIR
jgi:gliding motility-associated-like protein